MFELIEASVRYGRAEVLAPLSRRFLPGALAVVVGPNGAGKTTLLRLLTGELKPSAGEVLFDGAPLARLPAAALANRRAVLAQANHLSFPFTVREVVGLGLMAGVARNGAAGTVIDRVLGEVDLDGYQGRFYQQLSGGEQQRVQLARILCQLETAAAPPKHRFLFLDEPVSSLDIRHQIETMEIARRHARRGTGVVAVLHDLNLASRYADEVLVMGRGRCVADGPAAAALTPDLLERTFGVRFRGDLSDHDGRPVLLPVAAAAADRSGRAAS